MLPQSREDRQGGMGPPSATVDTARVTGELGFGGVVGRMEVWAGRAGLFRHGLAFAADPPRDAGGAGGVDLFDPGGFPLDLGVP